MCALPPIAIALCLTWYRPAPVLSNQWNATRNLRVKTFFQYFLVGNPLMCTWSMTDSCLTICLGPIEQIQPSPGSWYCAILWYSRSTLALTRRLASTCNQASLGKTVVSLPSWCPLTWFKCIWMIICLIFVLTAVNRSAWGSVSSTGCSNLIQSKTDFPLQTRWHNIPFFLGTNAFRVSRTP